MTKKPILLAGAGGHARACIDVIEQEGYFSVIGLVGLPEEVGLQVLGYPVVGEDRDLSTLLNKSIYVLVTVGQIKTPEIRIRLFNLIQQSGCILPTIISPRAYVSPHAKVGTGTVIMHGAIVNASAVVGRNCIINNQSLIDHDAIIEDHCHIATAATINSGVQIGSGTFIGSNSSVRQRINIGERCLIGMGQQVFADCKAHTHMPPLRNPSS